jgi:molybdenum cofactor cytidylyltransferase
VKICGVLLAAGGGTRFDGPSHKLVARLAGRPVWRHALDHLLAAGFPHTVVVTGAIALDVPAPAVAVPNERWSTGQASSLQAAVAAATAVEADAIVVGLADQPFVPAEAWAAVASAAPDRQIVVARYGDTIGPNPVRLSRDIWPLLPTDGDQGARRVLQMHPEWVSDVACAGSPADIDTLEDLERWTSC